MRSLLLFVDRDPRWAPLVTTPKWVAYRRTSTGNLAEDWTEQPFYKVHPPGAKAFAVRALRKLRHEGRRLLRR